MNRHLTMFAGLLLFAATAAGQSIRISFSAMDRLTASLVQLDSVRIENLSTMRDTVITDPFIIDLEISTSVGASQSVAIRSLEIGGNFANPFTDATNFTVTNGARGVVRLELFSLAGRRDVGMDAQLEAGTHSFSLKASSLPAGVYLLTARTGEFSRTVRIVKSGPAGGGSTAFSLVGSTGTIVPDAIRKAGASLYRFIGFAGTFHPDSVVAAPVSDTTIVFVMTRQSIPLVIERFSCRNPTHLLGDTAIFELRASSPTRSLSRLTIDYDRDGVMDDSVSVAGGSDEAVFQHVYPAPGVYNAGSCVVDIPGNTVCRNLDTVINVLQSERPPKILLFASDRHRRAKNLDIELTGIIYDADKDLEQVLLDFDADGAFDDSITVTQPMWLDTVRFTVDCGNTGLFNPILTARDKTNRTVSARLDSVIAVEEAIIRPQVIVILKGDIASHGMNFDSTWTFTFPTDEAERLGLRRGTILVSDTGLGFQRKVVELDTSSHTVRLVTEAAVITDIFEQVSFKFNRKLDSGMMTSRDGAEPSRNRDEVPANPAPLKIDMNDLVIYDHDKKTDTENDQISIDGSIELDPDIIFEFDVDWPSGSSTPIVGRAKAAVVMSIVPKFGFKHRLSLPFLEHEQLLQATLFSPIPVFVGPVPLVLSPQMRTCAGVEGQISADVHLICTLECNITSGLQYANGVWSPVSGFSPNFSALSPEFSTGLQFEGYIEERFLLLVNGLAGPYESTKLYFALDIDISRMPIMEVNGGAKAGAGIPDDFMGVTLEEHEEDDIIDTKVKLLDSGILEMPIITAMSRSSVTRNTEVEISGLHFGEAQNTGKVYFAGTGTGTGYKLVASDIAFWSDTTIILRVPAEVDGDGVVYISIEGRGSNRYPFTYRDWYIVSGRVIGLGLDLGGISITVGSRVTQTKADGSFEAHGLTTGTHAVTLRKEGLGFSPPAVYISIVDRDIEGLLFSAAPQSLFLPVLSTSSITQITATTARSGGNVYSDGGYPVTARGVCWSTAPDPTTSDSRTNDGTGNGVFTSSITGLKPNTTYYARAYAVNSMGTKYGNEISFVTQQGYEYIGIGGLKWMLKNLDVDRYSNGDPIPQVTDMAQWAGLTTGAWCYYDNDPATGAIYGKLYNWYAVNDPRGLAPSGWRIPTDLEWKDLEMQLGMTLEQANAIDSRGTDEGGKLKESGTLHWRAPNAGATNSSGFTALPGGYRTYGGNFSYMRDFGYWWTSSNWTRRLGSGSATVIRNTGDMRLGLSVRCVRH